jgi:peptidoglycan glycosyltransferase
VLFVLLAIRQLIVQVYDAPRLANDVHNPRLAQLDERRGAILASDGTPLALSRGAKRVYPEAAAFAHVVGYASPRYGTFGLEDAYDRALSAARTQNDPLAQIARLTHPGQGEPRGADVVTTLDVAIQRALVEQLAQYPRAAGVVLDPRTGAVLALASVPGFDPNALETTFPSLVASKASPLLDRVTNGLYPPGSTFKIVTAGMALDDGLVTSETTFTDTGGLPVGTFTVRNDEDEVTGTQTLVGAFALSSNVDFAKIALEIGRDRWFDGAAKFGLGDDLAFDLPTARDRLPKRAEVSDSVLAQLGFGQASLLVTPMHMALFACMAARDGSIPRPFVVRRIAGSDTNLAVKPEILATPVAPDVAATLKTMMVAVVARGTGTAAALPDVTVAGKTGTATNPAGKAHAWFVAFAPANAPRVAVAVVVENAGYGGTAAAPIVRAVLRTALAHTR